MSFEEIVVAAKKKDFMRACILSVRARNRREHDVSIDEGSVRGDCLVCGGRGLADRRLRRAFGQGNSSAGEGGNSTFADPDE